MTERHRKIAKEIAGDLVGVACIIIGTSTLLKPMHDAVILVAAIILFVAGLAIVARRLLFTK